MPRYYFHSEDGSFYKDEDGEELPNEAAAKEEAVRLTGALLKDRPQELWESQRWRMLVAKEGEGAVFGIEIHPVSGKDLVPWRRH